MNKYKCLLKEWCDYLVSRQQEDGGFSCEACETIHGRADNAIFPLVFMYSETKDFRYLNCAEKLLLFRKNFEHSDGAVQNDYGSQWKGITVFSAINLYKTLHFFSEVLPENFRKNLEEKFRNSCNWVYENIVDGFRANINYYAAASAVNAMCGEYFYEEKFTIRAKNLLDYCMKNFTENGLITGEGQPHNFTTKKGCFPVDIGYNLEESFPCLVDTAEILNDEKVLKKLSAYGKEFLMFMLPDGGWDNSFGSRNNKWTYYGSRTSDGCIGAFTRLGKFDPVFYEAAERTFEILSACTHNGALYGGRFYKENGQPPCVHHTFCHAVALADALCAGLHELQSRLKIPCETMKNGYKYFKELDTYKIRAGKWLATVTAYDFSTYTYNRGAAHSSGGALSLLYHQDYGAVVAGSVYEYKLTEPFNMQNPTDEVNHRTLIPRAEYKKDGKNYATCLDGNAQIVATESDGKIFVKVKSKFVCVEEKCAENDELFAEFFYEFSDEKIAISATINQQKSDINFVLPIIKNTAKISTENSFKKEEIFFLTGGFSADEFTFKMNEKITVSIS